MDSKTYQFSPSSLGLYSECPKCFWLTHNEKIKRPRTPFPTLPNGMDEILKKYFDSHITNNTVPKELAHIDNISLFPDMKKLLEWRNNFVGIRTSDEFDNTIMGAIDTLLVNKQTKELIILDFKTRGCAPNGNSHTYYVNQLTIYAWLLKQHGYTVADYAYLLFYYPLEARENDEMIFNHELVKVDIEPARAPAIIAKARTCLTQPIPQPSQECEFCNWRKKIADLEKKNTQQKLV